MTDEPSLFAPEFGDWQKRLAAVVDMMRDMSRHTDPQEMVRSYGERVRRLMPADDRLSLSRRGLEAPHYRITRSSRWTESINPWKEKDRLPLFSGGLLAELIYGEEPRLLDEIIVAADDPAAEYLAGYRSLLAMPLYDRGHALNMNIVLARRPNAFSREKFPELLWLSNLFGRATSNLVLSDELQQAYRALDREFNLVGEIQRSLLPAQLPRIPTLDLAAHYQPSARAGGDYYDFFPLPDGHWGLFIADVSGHGTPAAVLMAVTHAIAHTRADPLVPPGQVLEYINRHLAARYTALNESFVTAFYGVYDPAHRRLHYARAGHSPPRLKRCQDGSLLVLNGETGLPLGIWDGETYADFVQDLQPGDQIIFYTDGITEAHNAAGAMFGADRLDAALENCSLQAVGLLQEVLDSVGRFTAGHPADDDRTVVVARVS